MPGLTAAQRQQFEEEGYLVVEDVLDPREDVQPVLDEYDRVLDGIVESLLADEAIRSAHKELPFTDRLIAVSEESGRNFPQHFDISLPQKGVQYDTPMHHGPAVFNLLTNPKLLDVVESLVGPEIYSNPVQHIRTKLPARAVAKGKRNGLITAVDWHQDNGVVLPEADEATILTVWLPLTDATLDNGCMRVIPGSHRNGLADHCPTSDRGPTIPYGLLDLDRAKALPIRAGGFLMMTQRTVHSSLENTTNDQVRISLDLRYQPVGQPTGRPAFPGFVARSASQPETALRDPLAWDEMWLEARERLARDEDPTFNRWRADAPACA